MPDSTRTPVRCPHCGAAYAVNPEKVGRKVACRRCDEVFRARREEPEEVEGLEEGEELIPEGEPSSWLKGWSWAQIATAVLALWIAAIIAAWIKVQNTILGGGQP